MNSKIKALGFIEVLIGIVVAGIVATVFLGISVRAMKDLLLNERIENMSRIAVNGASIAQEVANLERSIVAGDEFLPKTVGQCYFPIRDDSGDTVIYKFFKEVDEGSFISFPDFNREQIVAYVRGEYDDELLYNEDYFIVMCPEVVDEENGWANVKFMIGDVHVAGQITNDTDVKDFTYYAVIDL